MLIEGITGEYLYSTEVGESKDFLDMIHKRKNDKLDLPKLKFPDQQKTALRKLKRQTTSWQKTPYNI